MIKQRDMLELLDSYGDGVTIATLGSHSALQILKGARDEGFHTLAICEKGRAVAYKRFRIADEILTIDSFKDVLTLGVIEELRDRKAVLVPHGSFIAYVGIVGIERELALPLVGNRLILRWEADRTMERQWLERAGIRMPRETRDPENIKGLSLVKFPGAKGGRGYFIVHNYEDFLNKSRVMREKGRITADDVARATIQEYIPGVNMYLSYFYSPLRDEVEFFSIDRRYEANIDGLTRIPAIDQADALIEPSYVVVGNTPIVARESLLTRIFEMGDELVRVSKNIAPPGMLGAFCLETMVDQNLEFIAFEVSARIVAGTNPFTGGSPYSRLMYGRGMSMGRRIAREVKDALDAGKEKALIT